MNIEYFSETKHTLLEDLKTPLSVVWNVLNARTEGMGLNATVRTFGVAKNTVLDWVQRCADLQPVLFLYSLVHRNYSAHRTGSMIAAGM